MARCGMTDFSDFVCGVGFESRWVADGLFVSVIEAM